MLQDAVHIHPSESTVSVPERLKLTHINSGSASFFSHLGQGGGYFQAANLAAQLACDLKEHPLAASDVQQLSICCLLYTSDAADE